MGQKISFAGILDNSTIDYPGKVSAVVYLCGCPFRCPWCHNPELVTGENCQEAEAEDIIAPLKANFLIKAVTVTGGEPLMQEATLSLLEKIKKDTGLLLKIDTNCFYPERLKLALPYLDHLTTDIKAPLDERYGKVVGLPGSWDTIVGKIKESHALLKTWDKPKEARTTIVPDLIDKKEDIEDIAKAVSSAGFSQYVLQQFKSEQTLCPEMTGLKSPPRSEILKLGRAAKALLPETKVLIVTQESGFEEIE